MEYPTEEELEEIRCWDSNDLHGLMAYIKPIWNYSDCGYWTQIGEEYHISTGGWSGNKEIVAALHKNTMFWMLFWKQSQRGGHYIFCKLGS